MSTIAGTPAQRGVAKTRSWGFRAERSKGARVEEHLIAVDYAIVYNAARGSSFETWLEKKTRIIDDPLPEELAAPEQDSHPQEVGGAAEALGRTLRERLGDIACEAGVTFELIVQTEPGRGPTYCLRSRRAPPVEGVRSRRVSSLGELANLVPAGSAVRIQAEPEIIDRCFGIIRDVGESIVSVSLFDAEDEEYLTELPIHCFNEANVIVRQGEGFRFHVERALGGWERFVVTPLKLKRVTRKKREEIRDEVRRLLDGDR